MYRVVLSVVFALGLSACSAPRPTETSKISLDQLVQSPDFLRNSNASTELPGQQTAFAVLPAEAGRVARVSQKVSADGFRQEIIYGQPVPGLGESGIDLRVKTANVVALEEPLVMTKPTEASIRAELAAEFPRMAMQVVDRVRSNAYGPYGMAVGRWANGARCMYAWQWIENVRINNFGEDGRPVSVRVRLCRTNVTLDQLATYVDRLQIDLSQSERLHAVAGKTEKTAAIFGSEKKPKSLRTAKLPDGRDTGRLGPRPRVSRVAVVAAAAVPQSSESIRENQLDPSLPAAAYRGPTTSGSTPALAQK